MTVSINNNITDFFNMQRLTVTLILCIFLFTSCKRNRLSADVSKIVVKDFTIDRMEQDMFEHRLGNMEQLFNMLDSKYDGFYSSFQVMLNGGGRSFGPGASDTEMLQAFLLDKDMNDVYNECKKMYSDFTPIHDELIPALKHFKFYFPDKKIPRIVTYMSGFNFSILRVDSTIGIGLDMYLGSENKFYQMIQFPRYKTKNMRKEYIVSDLIRGWMLTEYSKTDDKNDLLSDMIYNGKILYLVDAMLPTTPDSIKIGFEKNQLEWCYDNEYNMWATLIEKKLLFSSDQTETIKYIGEGPFTSTFSRDSPARTGIWIGWQIVRKYMDNNTDITLEQLMSNTNYQEILNKSKYKPK